MDDSKSQPERAVDSQPLADETMAFERSGDSTQQTRQSIESIGRYRIKKLLGAGAFGQVFLGYDDQLQREVAIKVTHRELSAAGGSGGNDAEAYLSEARMLAKLDHPHIVPVYDVGSTPEGRCFVVSKFIDGADLCVRMQQEVMPRREAVELAATVAEALHYAHTQGLVHRDIKPANLLIDGNGVPVVADFGLALQDETFGRGPQLAGTPAYMSPEQARGEGHLVDGRSDVFSLGVVLYELLVGKHPFAGDSSREMMDRVVALEVKPLRQRDDTIPKRLEEICLKALAKPIGERYTTAKDLADELRAYLDAHESHSSLSVEDANSAPPPPAVAKPRPVALAAGIAVVLLSAIGVFAPIIWVAFFSPPGDSSNLKQAAGASGAAAERDPSAVRVKQFEIQVSRDEGEFLPLDEVAPLRGGDAVHFSIELSKPAFVKLIWIDATGQTQELYPHDPEIGDRGGQRVLRIDSPIQLDRGWPIEGQGGREIALLLVSDKANFAAAEDDDTLDPKTIAINTRPAGDDHVMRYSVSRGQPPQARERPAHRSLGAKSQQSDDAILQLLERLRKKSDVVQAISIRHVAP